MIERARPDNFILKKVAYSAYLFVNDVQANDVELNNESIRTVYKIVCYMSNCIQVCHSHPELVCKLNKMLCSLK